MGLLQGVKRFLHSRKTSDTQDNGSDHTISRTSTIQSQTLGLVQQQSTLLSGASGEIKARKGTGVQPAANWERLNYSNGAEYLGWTSEGLREGSGKIEKGESVYEGQWHLDLPHGNGMFGGDNVIYEGNWEMGLPYGNGVAMLPDGSKYVGEWRDGLADGYGRLVTAGGQIYVGSFSKGLPNGDGVMITAEGVSISCSFIDGVPVGVGTIEWPSQLKYVGTIIEGIPHGLGRMANSQSVTLGLWKRGELETRLKVHESLPDALRDDPAVEYMMRN